MDTYDTSKQVPIGGLKKSTTFHLCYEYDKVIQSILKCWYGNKGDFFFYPNVDKYTIDFLSKSSSHRVADEPEKKHQRITIHQSGVIVGPDKHDRSRGQKYEKLRSSIKECKNGITLAIHRLGGPGIYSPISAKSQKKGNWVVFETRKSNIQPVITIDAYPIFTDEDIQKVRVKKNYICGFITKYFYQEYRILVLFELLEDEIRTDMATHAVIIPVKS